MFMAVFDIDEWTYVVRRYRTFIVRYLEYNRNKINCHVAQ